MRKANKYFDYEKPSCRKQWQERSDGVLHDKTITQEQVFELKNNLAASYGCDESDIKYSFEKIKDEFDTDRDDCVLLTYTINSIIEGRPASRIVWSMKVEIPEHLRRMAEQQTKRNLQHRTRGRGGHLNVRQT